MQYITHYQSPLSGITISSDGTAITGLWFNGQKYFASTLGADYKEENLPVFTEAKRWLDMYFSGREPDFTPPLALNGSAFRMAVWQILQSIPYGQTITYGAIAQQLAAQAGQAKMSAQAVGGAVGHNPISIIVPCHRVVGAGGSLTGYAGGIGKKVQLLELEGIDTNKFTVPTKGTAL